MPLRLTGSRWNRTLLPLLAVLGACSHSDVPTLGTIPTQGPFGTASPLRVTFNSGDDAFPVYSGDGASIAYAYAAPARPDRDRCIGILPSAGGTRTFSLCEERVVYADSTDTITPIGLHADGRLYYMHSTTTRFALVPGQTRIYVTDTAGSAPTLLTTLPAQVAGGAVSWLANVHWTSDHEFVALGQQMTAVPRCGQCGAARDTVFVPVAIMRGTVTDHAMTLATVAGTEGASGYGLNAAKTEMLFEVGGAFFRLPIAGGTPTLTASMPGGYSFIDMDCGGDVCAVLAATPPGPGRAARIGNALLTVPFGGAAFTARASATTFTWWGVRVSPAGSDFLLSVSGASDARDLYIFRGLL
jgi:hypothetical protein